MTNINRFCYLLLVCKSTSTGFLFFNAVSPTQGQILFAGEILLYTEFKPEVLFSLSPLILPSSLYSSTLENSHFIKML